MSVQTIVPVIDENLQHRDVVLKSGSQVTIREWISTSYSQNNATFSCPPPSNNIFIDRCIYCAIPLTIDYTGTTTGSALLQSGYDSLRFMPLSTITNSAQLTLNNQQFILQTNEITPYLARYKKPTNWNLSPAYMDKYQRYVDGVTANNNPLGTYADGAEQHVLRGAFPMVVTNGATASKIVTTVVEPLYVPPLTDNYEGSLGFTNINTMSIVLNYSSNLARVVSHAASLATLTGVTVTLGQPVIYMRYTTPPPDYTPTDMTYGNQTIAYWTTPVATITANTTVTIPSTNIQLGMIPTRMYVFVRESNANLTYASTDTFTNISNVSIQFDNQSGLLATASEYDLYSMSRDNGLQCTWPEWHGIVQSATIGTPIGSTGSILCLEFGKDIPLKSSNHPGTVGPFNIQMNVTVKNVNQSASIVAPTLYIITVSPSKIVCHVSGNIDHIQGVDDSVLREYISYQNVKEYYGGSFKDVIGKVISFFKPVNDFLKKTKAISNISGLLSNVPALSGIAGPISSVSRSLGYGDNNRAMIGGMTMGGMEMGGRQMSRAQLKERIQRI